MTNGELEKIIQITDKATKSPWASYWEGRDFDGGSSFIMTGMGKDRDYDMELGNIRMEDQDFIAMARNVLPELVAEVQRLQKILNENSISF